MAVRRRQNIDDADISYANAVEQEEKKGSSFAQILNICPQPPFIKDMTEMARDKYLFMIKPFKYNGTAVNVEPQPIYQEYRYVDLWDEHHVRMPCSPSVENRLRTGQPRWPYIQQVLRQLKAACDNRTATMDHLKRTIEFCAEKSMNVECLEQLINQVYSSSYRTYFLSTVLSNICSLAINVDSICSQPPPLLRMRSNRAVTMSQYQAASLLSCAFFCLFPFRVVPNIKREYQYYQNPNFEPLYQRGPKQKVEKLKCILHYFHRITRQKPTGVITFKRRELHSQHHPKWSQSTKTLEQLCVTTSDKIEDIDGCLQVDFANRFIGGGVLLVGCVQEEIRFVLCPEMLVSLLICEMMTDNECIFLIGCERYSTYKGYGSTFQFAGDFGDNSPKDNWGRKASHLVAIDALFFRQQSEQFYMKPINRELIKAYTGFATELQPNGGCTFPVASGNWGCGAFNGDRQLKAIIQLIAASEAGRPLVYAAFGDRKLAQSLTNVYNHLTSKRTTVKDLYRCLSRYTKNSANTSLFDFILQFKSS